MELGELARQHLEHHYAPHPHRRFRYSVLHKSYSVHLGKVIAVLNDEHGGNHPTRRPV